MDNFEVTEKFIDRHIGIKHNDINEMIRIIGLNSLDELIEKTIPQNIRLSKEIKLDTPLTEVELLHELKRIASKNKIFKNYIGQGYNTTILPSVIKRNILENPGWYTQYTPYQAEISQGRLEALLNFQTMVSDLTGLPLSNASLLDEATAAAEAMSMVFSLRKGVKKKANVLLVSDNIFPQTIDVLKTRAYPLGIEIKIVNEKSFELGENVFAILVQYPGNDGSITDYTSLFNKATDEKIFKIVTADILSLALLKPPAEFGADVVVGSTQRFGVPLGFGGPHAAYFATKEEYKRAVPGRIIGVSVDTKGRRALRMALQTREQHIKRERATSNICTAQVLLAILASMYAVYHGPKGLKKIAKRIHSITKHLESKLKSFGYEISNQFFFDTLKIKLQAEVLNQIKKDALDSEINLRYFDDHHIGIAIGEDVTVNDINELLDLFEKYSTEKKEENKNAKVGIPNSLLRESEYLTHPVFNSYHSETEMMRYIKSLEKKDLSLTTSMIPLGSCTMKLNAATEMFAITWQEFTDIHPFAPLNQAQGYLELFKGLEKQITELTGLSAVSLQPNSGAQGEYTGLMVIKAYQKDIGEENRNIVLIPSSAHGTNPASAVLAGNKVVIVNCDENGNIDVDDLKYKAEQNKENLSALMITYPSTHGVFEKDVVEMVDIIHSNGGMVYMDGANLNAQLGLTSPGKIGADVCHLNLHKTFAIPHGGGGPGVGPIAVNEKLKDYLPGHSVVNINKEKSIHSVSAAPWGSAGVLSISYAYIRMMGSEGLTMASKIAILNANYIKEKLKPSYKTLYTGSNGFVGHELILDTREFKQRANIDVIDIAKRLMDYGYHAPTVSFPVHGTLMVEPTESESKNELDKFCEVMESIYKEIIEIEKGEKDKDDNVLKNSPHTLDDIITEWKHPYSIKEAVAPVDWVKDNKFWPTVGRVDDAYGDRNLVCSCLPIEEYED
jgi:glycine dehydrogenase